MNGYKSHKLKRTCHMHQGCGCSPRGCGLTLLLLYLMQCLATTAALWHKYDTRTIEGVQLTLYYPAHESASMYIPGLGALRLMLHWASWGKEYELVKALDIQLPDHRRYTLHSENFQSLNQLRIRQSPEGIQLTDDQGQDFVDTPLIPYPAFQERATILSSSQ